MQALESQAIERSRRETESLLHGFLDVRATTDNSLSVEQSEIIVTTIVNKDREEGVSNSAIDTAARVGRRLAIVADEIDTIYGSEVDEIVKSIQTPERAFSTFHEVARRLFECTDETAKITVGRIYALLAYCYRICKYYAMESPPASSMMVLLGAMGGWLVTFLAEVGFYAWLGEQGGWAQLLAGPMTTLWNSSMLVVGVLCIGYWAFKTLWK